MINVMHKLTIESWKNEKNKEKIIIECVLLTLGASNYLEKSLCHA